MAAEDHPRIRGEHSGSDGAEPGEHGSSPHTRGAPTAMNASFPTVRIIPAYAGSTGPGVFDPPRGRDHPRIRGEHFRHPPSSGRRLGSSPHTRGALILSGVSGRWTGIIPAYAGSTHGSSTIGDGSRDHPRIRGEHYDFDVWCWNSCGSSPHTRGALRSVSARSCATGIIPAYAGSTGRRQGAPPRRGDHPRIRGEHRRQTIREAVLRGSSPHTRGAPLLACAHDRDIGIIPAYAGSTA